MARRPAIRPDARRQWLLRYEEKGESVPQIARVDGYDVRTVRKQLELARQEREQKDARSLVLRQALEQHYGDLCAFAQKLDSLVSSNVGSLTMLRGEHMWSALREHLPRSVIWRNFDRWEQLEAEVEEVEREMGASFPDLVRTRLQKTVGDSSWEGGVTEGIVAALLFECGALAQGTRGLLDGVEFKVTRLRNQATKLELGAFHLGEVPEERLQDIQDVVKGLLNEIGDSEVCRRLVRSQGELQRVERVIRDELAVIILRRVVPGRCRYCPA